MLKKLADGVLSLGFLLISRLALGDPVSALRTLDPTIRQVVMVEVSGSPAKARLTSWGKKKEDWQAVFEPMEAVVGRNGLAPQDQKKEGDGRTPSGIYPLGMAFGYEPTVRTKLSYRQVTPQDFWVDDAASAQYNQWVTEIPQAKSYERLRREDDLYKYVVVIEYNTHPVLAGKGSAIFLHVWRDAVTPTAGCVAVSQKNLLRLLDWLDPSFHPVIFLGLY